MSGTCQHCHRRRPQLKVKRKGVWLNVCAGCAQVLIQEENVELEEAVDAEPPV